MKKIILSTILVLALSKISAQETKFGVTAGYNSLIASVKVEGVSASASASGLYGGLFADITATEKFHIQPEILFSYTSKDGDSGEILVLPIIGKYYVSEKLSLQAGPQLDYLLEKDSEGFKKLGVGMAMGMGYDISDKFFAVFRYAFGLTNRFDESAFVFDEGDSFEADFDIKSKLNFLNIGIGYKF